MFRQGLHNRGECSQAEDAVPTQPGRHPRLLVQRADGIPQGPPPGWPGNAAGERADVLSPPSRPVDDGSCEAPCVTGHPQSGVHVRQQQQHHSGIEPKHSKQLCHFGVNRERERKMFYLTTHSTHFIYGYMASDIWLRTILIVREETRCLNIGYSYRLTARFFFICTIPQSG